MPKTADRTGGVRLHRETPPNPAWVRASRPAGWPPQQPVRRPRGRLWRQGYRTPGRCGLSDRVARQPRSMRRHPQSPAFLPFGWHSDPRREQLWRGPEQSGVQRNGLAPDPTPTGRRYGSCGHSLLVRIHAYLSCSTISYRKEALHHNYRARTRTMSFFDAQKCEGRARGERRHWKDPPAGAGFTTLISSRRPQWTHYALLVENISECRRAAKSTLRYSSAAPSANKNPLHSATRGPAA